MNPNQNCKGGLLFASALTAGNAASGYIDCKGANNVEIDVSISDIATPTISSANGCAVAVTESDDTNASNFAALTGATSQTAIKLKRLVKYSILRGPQKKRYVKVTVTAGTAGVSNDAVVACAANARLSNLEGCPTNAADIVTAAVNGAANTNNAAVIVP